MTVQSVPVGETVVTWTDRRCFFNEFLSLRDVQLIHFVLLKLLLTLVQQQTTKTHRLAGISFLRYTQLQHTDHTHRDRPHTDTPSNTQLMTSNCETRSQAVARIADRTASRHIWGSCDVIGHMTIWYSICHFLLVVRWNGISISSRFRDIALLSIFGSQVWPFKVTWCHRSSDHLIDHMPFPIGGLLEPSLYL